MQKIDDFIIKENSRFFADFEEWKNGNGYSFEDGDMVKFTFEGVKYRGKLFKQSKDENIFEIKNLVKIP